MLHHVANFAFAVPTVVLLLLIWWGLLSMVRNQKATITYHMALGVCAIIWSIILRVLYWDVLPVIATALQPGLWEKWSGWTVVNILWDLLVIFGAWHLSTALWLLIPDTERQHWSRWTAWFYPHRRPLARLYDWIRGR